MRRNNQARAHGGPLMTEHLQIQDIDLELELLKRKREMIEHQQQMLTNSQPFNRPRPFDYGNNQPRPLFQEQHQPFANNSSFTRFYDQPQQSQGYGGGGLLGKRPNDVPVWQAQSAPKRFSGPQSGPKKRFSAGPSPKTNDSRQSRNPNQNSGSYSQFNKPGPRQMWDTKPKSFGSMNPSFPSQRFNNTPKGSKPPQRDFKPTKVTKSKPHHAGNKLSSHSTPDRKKVQQTAKAKASKDFDEYLGDQFILRADKVPSQQMAGRLELALGQILKDIKAKYGDAEPHVVSFQSQFLQRKMKGTIRERLRSVMLGKHVGKVNTIVESYRKVFPISTDDQIVQIALAEQQNNTEKQLVIKLESADSAFKYLRTNMSKLVGAALDDMFSKVLNIYDQFDEEKTKGICQSIIADAEDFTKDVDPEADKNVSTEGVDEEGKDSDKVDEVNGEGEVVKDSEIPSDESEAKTNGEDASAGLENLSGGVASNEEKPLNGEKPSATDETSGDVEQPSGALPPTYPVKPNWKRIDEHITTLIKRKLPYVLPKFKPQLIKILNSVSFYKITKTHIFDKTQERLDLENRIEQAKKNNTSIDLSNEETVLNKSPEKVQPEKFAFMVKILGRPVLPKRKLMQTFLDQFKPASVKKHRNMHLLFVALDNKESYDKILAVKEQLIGNCTICIKPSEKPASKADESVNNSTMNESMEKVIGGDLDEQINDLLSSIRKEEESVLDEAVNKDVEEAPASENTENGNVSNENESAAAVNGTETSQEEKEPEVTTENNDDKQEPEEKVENQEANDKVEALKADAKETGRSTPTRASSRLANVATPSSVRTRRASKLTQN